MESGLGAVDEALVAVQRMPLTPRWLAWRASQRSSALREADAVELPFSGDAAARQCRPRADRVGALRCALDIAVTEREVDIRPSPPSSALGCKLPSRARTRPDRRSVARRRLCLASATSPPIAVAAAWSAVRWATIGYPCGWRRVHAGGPRPTGVDSRWSVALKRPANRLTRSLAERAGACAETPRLWSNPSAWWEQRMPAARTAVSRREES